LVDRQIDSNRVVFGMLRDFRRMALIRSIDPGYYATNMGKPSPYPRMIAAKFASKFSTAAFLTLNLIGPIDLPSRAAQVKYVRPISRLGGSQASKIIFHKWLSNTKFVLGILSRWERVCTKATCQV
jgi:hypothetical protein